MCVPVVALDCGCGPGNGIAVLSARIPRTTASANRLKPGAQTLTDEQIRERLLALNLERAAATSLDIHSTHENDCSYQAKRRHMDKFRLPTVNQVTVLGVIKQVEHKPSNLFSWLFYVEVPSTYRNNETMLICGTNGNGFREIVQKVVLGRDWALINGKIRIGGFIQVREISIIPEPQLVSSGIHHVGLVGKSLDKASARQGI